MGTTGDKLTRRTVLRAGVAAVAVAGLGTVFATTARATDREPAAAKAKERARARVLVGGRSANGWEMEAGADIGGSIWTRPITGSPVTVALRIGAVAVVLTHVVRRFHYEIGALNSGEALGYQEEASVTGYETNHASGTAVDLRPGWYRPGVSGGFLPAELVVLRDVLRDCEGIVSWGGDRVRPDEGHFQIEVGPDDPRLAKVAAKIQDWNSKPGKGAGVLLALS
ncbi:M15 family metallopeptidase [Crossiella sp. CA198]|uniref:M15 family metallopeptidase n=1 Tax=Crossiella sp. CA198 TaxID=3455607 RepID=UPI003F8D69DD